MGEFGILPGGYFVAHDGWVFVEADTCSLGHHVGRVGVLLYHFVHGLLDWVPVDVADVMVNFPWF